MHVPLVLWSCCACTRHLAVQILLTRNYKPSAESYRLGFFCFHANSANHLPIDEAETLADARLPAAGNVVVRKNKGQESRVLILADGFDYQGAAIPVPLGGNHTVFGFFDRIKETTLIGLCMPKYPFKRLER